ncbi:hypothetical protein F4776DRAFT_670821 [Hypoxylon sp. NC0597]|nr:hypothetical protein F4776DRAFT_670821 [Hypoxylon sp. NC0597]
MPSSESHDERVKRIRAAIEGIKTLYEAGAPLFTKAAIKKFAEELDAFERGVLTDNKVVLRTFDGKDVSVDVCPNSENGKKIVAAIRYEAIDHITDEEFHLFLYGPVHFLPLQVAYRQERLREDRPDCTTEDLYLELGNARKEWEQSEHHAQLRNLLASVKLPCDIKKVIGFALGSFSFPNWGQRCRVQHSILMSIHQWASANMGEKTKPQCYVQDPAYSNREKQILEEMGVTALNDPWGFLEADESSIIISISPDVPVRQIITDIARPAMILWDKLDEWAPDGALDADPPSSRVIEMLSNEYTAFEFPPHEATTPLVLYVRNGPSQSGLPAPDA